MLYKIYEIKIQNIIIFYNIILYKYYIRFGYRLFMPHIILCLISCYYCFGKMSLINLCM